MKNFLVLFLFLITIEAESQTKIEDKIDSLNRKVNNIEYSLEQIQRDRINYQIEKDLLKETYSRNYETINIIITLILGIIGLLGFLGLRDINSIKKEYSNELQNLKRTKLDFDIKSKELEKDKGKFEEEIRKIVETNEKQNNKIKILELKEKINKLIENDKLSDALEYLNAALEIAPNDTILLTNHGIVNTRLNRLDKANFSFKKAFEIDSDNETHICNLIEFYSITNNFKEAELLIEKHKTIFEDKGNGGLKVVKETFEIYYNKDNEALRDYVKSNLDKKDLESQKKRFSGWRFTEALFIAAYQSDSDRKDTLKNFLWYLDGQINGNTLINNLNIKI